MENVIMVDENDHMLGVMEKMEAHKKGILHRAFSVLLFNTTGELLLQKRSLSKYHSGGLWTNTCCSHPLPEESIEEAIIRKLNQELGIKVLPLPHFAYKFIYKAHLDKGLTEHELDHVFIGVYDGTPIPNRDEVEDWKFMSLQGIHKDIKLNPKKYTYWFNLIINDPQLTRALSSYAICE